MSRGPGTLAAVTKGTCPREATEVGLREALAGVKRALQGSGPVFNSCPFPSPSCPTIAPVPVSPSQRGLARVPAAAPCRAGKSRSAFRFGNPGPPALGRRAGSAGRGGEAVVKLGLRASVGAGRRRWGRWRGEGWGAGMGGGLSPNPTPASFPRVTKGSFYSAVRKN